jgi:hypothetical protein
LNWKQNKKEEEEMVSCQSIERNTSVSSTVHLFTWTHPFFKLVFIKGKALTADRVEGKKRK